MTKQLIYFLDNGSVKIRDKEYSRQELYDLYIVQNNTILGVASILGIKKSSMSNILKTLQLSKAKEAGVEYYTQTSQFKERCRQTSLQKYGVEHPAQSSIVQDKIKTTNLAKYGVEYTTQTDSMKEKSRNTVREHYGVDYASQSAEIKDKVKKTNLQRYGVECVFQSSEIQQQIAETNVEKYGVENPFGNKAVQQKIRRTLLQKYGVDSIKLKDLQHVDIWQSQELFTQYVQQCCQDHKPNVMELCAFFNCEQTALYKKIHSYCLEEDVDWYFNRSYYEDEIIQWLLDSFGDLHIIRNERTILGNNLEIDIYLPDYRIGIEFNGDYWHSDLFEKYQDHNGRSTRHQEKSLLAESKGVLLFQIFEHEWNSPTVQLGIKNRLTTLLQHNAQSIYGRQCVVQYISEEQKKQFLNDNHIQGNDHSSIYLGLFYNKTLVSCMTFCKSKFAKYQYELSRFCSLHNTTIVGGASKLFNYFIKNILNSGETVVSYNDITKTSGKVYNILGFINISINPPNYIWVNFNTGEIRSRYQEQKGGEVERMHAQGFHRVCDCGTKTWVYTKKQ